MGKREKVCINEKSPLGITFLLKRKITRESLRYTNQGLLYWRRSAFNTVNRQLLKQNYKWAKRCNYIFKSAG